VILIGLGGNLASPRHGPPRATLEAALGAIEAAGIGVDARSAWYRSEPVPRSDQPWFVNAVATLNTERDPADLLAALQDIEARFGRIRGERNAARILDLDILDYRGRSIETETLILPHPRLHLRRFVLVPLAELAPHWRHRRFGLTASEMLARLTAGDAVFRLPDAADCDPSDCARSTGPI
jgi:2-amino-4-hydroxy-6-hydroxymethyldihydropteridine diphosphokinase